MRVLILGGDGYLGWPTAMSMAAAGHEVTAVDNYLRRHTAEETDSEALLATPTLSERARIFKQVSGHDMKVVIGDLLDHEVMDEVVKESQPDTIIHYAEQPSAPYSMRNARAARLTLHNNVGVTMNVIWSMIEHAPDAHLVKLGTMGEYGTPNIDIEEGWIDITHKGREGRFLFPRAAGSLYHTTKVLDTDLLWFYVRTSDLRVTDLMQGPVYGISSPEADMDPRLVPNFHYDDIFGTLINRFLVQAVAGVPLTVYGKGGQVRGYLNLNDTLQCVNLAMESPVEPGELRILNQFTETFSVNDVADRVKRVGDAKGLNVEIKPIPNPRKEAEDHYYNPMHSGLTELGLEPHFMTDEVIAGMLDRIIEAKDSIVADRIMPRVVWNK